MPGGARAGGPDLLSTCAECCLVVGLATAPDPAPGPAPGVLWAVRGRIRVGGFLAVFIGLFGSRGGARGSGAPRFDGPPGQGGLGAAGGPLDVATRDASVGERSYDTRRAGAAARAACRRADICCGAAGAAAPRAARPPFSSFVAERARVRDRVTTTSAGTACINRFGEGGMAEVYMAVPARGRGLPPPSFQAAAARAGSQSRRRSTQFIDEARLGASLVHSNIVPVFDFGKVDDEYFMAQEYILGRDLGSAHRAPCRAASGARSTAPRLSSRTKCWRRSATRTSRRLERDVRWGSSTATSRRASDDVRPAAR